MKAYSSILIMMFPNNVEEIIVGHIDDIDLSNARLVSKKWRNIIQTNMEQRPITKCEFITACVNNNMAYLRRDGITWPIQWLSPAIATCGNTFNKPAMKSLLVNLDENKLYPQCIGMLHVNNNVYHDLIFSGLLLSITVDTWVTKTTIHLACDNDAKLDWDNMPKVDYYKMVILCSIQYGSVRCYKKAITTLLKYIASGNISWHDMHKYHAFCLIDGPCINTLLELINEHDSDVLRATLLNNALLFGRLDLYEKYQHKYNMPIVEYVTPNYTRGLPGSKINFPELRNTPAINEYILAIQKVVQNDGTVNDIPQLITALNTRTYPPSCLFLLRWFYKLSTYKLFNSFITLCIFHRDERGDSDMGDFLIEDTRYIWKNQTMTMDEKIMITTRCMTLVKGNYDEAYWSYFMIKNYIQYTSIDVDYDKYDKEFYTIISNMIQRPMHGWELQEMLIQSRHIVLYELFRKRYSYKTSIRNIEEILYEGCFYDNDSVIQYAKQLMLKLRPNTDIDTIKCRKCKFPLNDHLYSVRV